MGAKTDARNAPTVGALVEIYLTKGLAAKPDKKVSSWKTDESNLRRHVIPLLGKKKARDVIKADIEHFRRDVTNGKTIAEEKTKSRGRAIVRGGAGTALRSAAVLSAMLKWAFEQELIPHNPAVGINLSRQKLSRQKFLSAGEIYSLAQSLDKLEHTGVNATPLEAIRVLLFTGARRNEILNLKWEYLDLDEGRINLPDSKTGAKSIPLGAPALEVLARQPRNDVSPWVFPSRRGGGPYVGLRKVFLQACKLAKLKNVRIHDLRHSFASFAVAGGATLFVTGKILGHKQARATEVYAHLDDDPLKAAANRISKRIAAATRNQPKKNVVAIGRSN